MLWVRVGIAVCVDVFVFVGVLTVGNYLKKTNSAVINKQPGECFMCFCKSEPASVCKCIFG